MNICFTSQKKDIKHRVLNIGNGFYEVFAPPPQKIDILVIAGRGDVSPFCESDIDTCIFSCDNAEKLMKLNVKSAISCGMQSNDSVTFSSIDDDSALMCIRRQLIFSGRAYDPCEVKTLFNRRLGIYPNLVVSLIDYLSKNQGEEYESF